VERDAGLAGAATSRLKVDELARLLQALQAEVKRRHAGRHAEPERLATRTKIPEGILGAWYGPTRRTRRAGDTR
jgi:hypothetical protein